MYKDYDISKSKWWEIKNRVIDFGLNSKEIIKLFNLNSKQVWFLYDKLLQEKYNHLYTREKLVNPRVNDYVYCNYDGFGRGKILTVHKSRDIFFVKFNNRTHQTICSLSNLVTINDEVKRKITRL